jgi:hypothetical protein
MEILRKGQYRTYNQVAPGKLPARSSKPDLLWQANQGKADDITISNGFQFGKSYNQVLVVDKDDKVRFTDKDWKLQKTKDGKAKTVHDDASDKDGYLYKDSKGNKVLVSGITDPDKVKLGPSKPDKDLAPKPNKDKPESKAETKIKQAELKMKTDYHGKGDIDQRLSYTEVKTLYGDKTAKKFNDVWEKDGKLQNSWGQKLIDAKGLEKLDVGA